jgi:hypothetical protein
MLATIRLSSGTDGTNEVGVGGSTTGVQVAVTGVAVGSGDTVAVEMAGVGLAELDMQPLKPVMIRTASRNPDLDVNTKRPALFKRNLPLQRNQ